VAEAGAATGLPKVRSERPRVLLRAKAWGGPSIEKIRRLMKSAEYRARAKKLERTLMGKAVLYVVGGDARAGREAVAGLKKFRISGRTNTMLGDSAQKCAVLYDWLHGHPDFDAAARKAVRAHMEAYADKCVAYLKGGGETPFYCRLSSMLSGLTMVGLALHGDSPKAEGYVRCAQYFLKEKYGTIREVEDGATAGSSYGLHWQFTHLARMVGAWRSASDWDAARWIREHQGNWLERQLLFQIWWTCPNGWFVKDGDMWPGNGDWDNKQFRMQVDAVTGMYRSGVGRTWADGMARRYPHATYFSTDYHSEYIWEFFVFNDPDVKPEPLEKLGRAQVFSPKLHGFVCWRSSWKPDATLVYFKAGPNCDCHGTEDQGKFLIFKRRPLAIKSGAYIGWGSKHHNYLRSAWSANCVIFTGEKYHGYQPGRTKFDGTPSWKEWLARRSRYEHPFAGKLLESEAKEGFARALADLSGSTHPSGSKWTRELVFLGYKYLLVLDRVKPGPGCRHRWTLHTVNRPKIDGGLAVADNDASRLFCRTLLPEKAKFKVVGNFEHLTKSGAVRTLSTEKKYDERARMGQWRLDVAPADPKAETVYLHVLCPAGTETQKMPECSLRRRGGEISVGVDGLKYTFKPVK
jgi:hypothetical protein